MGRFLTNIWQIFAFSLALMGGAFSFGSSVWFAYLASIHHPISPSDNLAVFRELGIAAFVLSGFWLLLLKQREITELQRNNDNPLAAMESISRLLLDGRRMIDRIEFFNLPLPEPRHVKRWIREADAIVKAKSLTKFIDAEIASQWPYSDAPDTTILIQAREMYRIRPRKWWQFRKRPLSERQMRALENLIRNFTRLRKFLLKIETTPR